MIKFKISYPKVGKYSNILLLKIYLDWHYRSIYGSNFKMLVKDALNKGDIQNFCNKFKKKKP